MKIYVRYLFAIATYIIIVAPKKKEHHAVSRAHIAHGTVFHLM